MNIKKSLQGYCVWELTNPLTSASVCQSPQIVTFKNNKLWKLKKIVDNHLPKVQAQKAALHCTLTEKPLKYLLASTTCTMKKCLELVLWQKENYLMFLKHVVLCPQFCLLLIKPILKWVLFHFCFACITMILVIFMRVRPVITFSTVCHQLLSDMPIEVLLK